MKVYKAYIDAMYSSAGVLIAAPNKAAANAVLKSYNDKDNHAFRQLSDLTLMPGLQAAGKKARIIFYFGHSE